MRAKVLDKYIFPDFFFLINHTADLFSSEVR